MADPLESDAMKEALALFFEAADGGQKREDIIVARMVEASEEIRRERRMPMKMKMDLPAEEEIEDEKDKAG